MSQGRARRLWRGCCWLVFAMGAPAWGAETGRAGLPAQRAWQVVTVEGRYFPAELRSAIATLDLVRLANDEEVSVPFQIDERDEHGAFALPQGPAASADERPGVFDDNDLLVFRAGDCGARGDVPGAAEIEVSDPRSGADGWVYLRRRADRAPARRDDVEYDPDTDTVRARRYVVGFGEHTSSFFAFRNETGEMTANLLDRVKARVTARILWGLFEFRRSEEDLTARVLAWRDGPLRLIRRAQLKIRLGLGLPSPLLIAEDFFSGDTFEGPVLVRLPFDLRYAFGDLDVRIFLDFAGLDGYRLFSEGLAPVPVGCDTGVPDTVQVRADWFGMTGPAGTFVHALRVSPALRTLDRRLYVAATTEPDAPERVPGNCPGVGYRLTHWKGIGRGTHRMGLVIHAFHDFQPGDAKRFLSALDHPLAVSVGAVAVEADD